MLGYEPSVWNHLTVKSINNLDQVQLASRVDYHRLVAYPALRVAVLSLDNPDIWSYLLYFKMFTVFKLSQLSKQDQRQHIEFKCIIQQLIRQFKNVMTSMIHKITMRLKIFWRYLEMVGLWLGLASNVKMARKLKTV